MKMPNANDIHQQAKTDINVDWWNKRRNFFTKICCHFHVDNSIWVSSEHFEGQPEQVPDCQQICAPPDEEQENNINEGGLKETQ